MATCSFIPDKTSGVGVLLRLEYDNSSWPGSEIIYMVVPLRFLGPATAFLPYACEVDWAFGIPTESLSPHTCDLVSVTKISYRFK